MVAAGLVFDGVLQQFYDTTLYYKLRDANALYRYMPNEGRTLSALHQNYGSWR
jgi:hypothetical protein